ncbi:MAG: TetR/AcrR family transcriptional regulator [Bacillus sp. (in: firmicutes)]
MAEKRETLTKLKIKNAFVELVNEKGMESLTISDIARKAKINRGTFYLHYVDKIDLLEQLETDVLLDLEVIFEKYDKGIAEDPIEIIPYEAILEALKYVRNDFAFVSALMNIGGNSKTTERLKQLIRETIQKQISRSENLSFQMGNLPPDYAQEILLSGILSIILLWIRKGAVETPEEIAAMITKAKQIAPNELLL